jgi:hypothetical protein
MVADKITFSNADHPLLIVNASQDPVLKLRVIPSMAITVIANVSINNMNLAEFAECTDITGTFRGFPEQLAQPGAPADAGTCGSGGKVV